MTQHSPTPWAITNFGYDDNLIYKIQIGTSQETVCYAFSGTGDATKKQKANAAFIVRACNAHDVLIAEVEKTVAMMATAGVGYNETGLRAALKLARGEA